MGSLHKKVIKALKKRISEDVIDGLETIKSTRRVTGWVASSGFDRLDDQQRQTRLWRALKLELDPEELDRVGPIVALTPAETEIDVSRDV